MGKGFLLKAIVLVTALACVSVVMLVTGGSNFELEGAKAHQTQTLFEQFVVAGGPIVWFVLLPMSLTMVYLAVENSLVIRRKKLFPDGVGRRIAELTHQFGPGQLEGRIGEQEDIVSAAVLRAVTYGRDDRFRLRNLLFESLEEQALRLLRRIEWVSLIGNVSPMVGLFGTVFGMIKLFNAIVTAGGQPRPAQLAEGISVALVTTLWGLLIAIPALAIHGVFRNRIETITSAATAEAENILPQIIQNLKRQAEDGKPAKQKPLIRELGGRKPAAIRESSVPS
jgi:biopolymer transport protein ExbB